MQQQFWVTKKSVLRKLGGKEDECVIASDAELDAKLELFKSISDSCLQLQRVIDLYQERLCFLAQEENALGRYMKECGKAERNANAGHILAITGKALSYNSHQRLTVRPSLVRLHHEVETFRGRGVSDTRGTIMEMEKARTEYRAALSWMKSASSQLDPDTGHGLEKFRKAQAYVKSTKSRFDRLKLACLQKVDLLAAARCNMFSHALVPYQETAAAFVTKATEIMAIAGGKLQSRKPFDFTEVVELAIEQDKDRSTFFNAEYRDKEEQKEPETKELTESQVEVSNLLGEDFTTKAEQTPSHSGDLWPQPELFGGDFMPSKLLQEDGFDFSQLETSTETSQQPKKDKDHSQVSWLSLFAELDPLASIDAQVSSSGDRA